MQDHAPPAETLDPSLAPMHSTPGPLTVIHRDGTRTSHTVLYVHVAGSTPEAATVECGLHCEGTS